MEFTSHNPEETKNIAAKLAEAINLDTPCPSGATVVGLSGDLGAGKTTFMKYFAKEFGVEEEVQSPTFIIMRIFDLPSPDSRRGSRQALRVRGEVFKKLIHIDAYRLESGDDLLKLGWDNLVADPTNLICIEWPEKVAEILKPAFMLHFSHGKDLQVSGKENENERHITFEKTLGIA